MGTAGLCLLIPVLVLVPSVHAQLGYTQPPELVVSELVHKRRLPFECTKILFNHLFHARSPSNSLLVGWMLLVRLSRWRNVRPGPLLWFLFKLHPFSEMLQAWTQIQLCRRGWINIIKSFTHDLETLQMFPGSENQKPFILFKSDLYRVNKVSY